MVKPNKLRLKKKTQRIIERTKLNKKSELKKNIALMSLAILLISFFAYIVIAGQNILSLREVTNYD